MAKPCIYVNPSSCRFVDRYPNRLLGWLPRLNQPAKSSRQRRRLAHDWQQLQLPFPCRQKIPILWPYYFASGFPVNTTNLFLTFAINQETRSIGDWHHRLHESAAKRPSRQARLARIRGRKQCLGSRVTDSSICLSSVDIPSYFWKILIFWRLRYPYLGCTI